MYLNDLFIPASQSICESFIPLAARGEASFIYLFIYLLFRCLFLAPPRTIFKTLLEGLPEPSPAAQLGTRQRRRELFTVEKGKKPSVVGIDLPEPGGEREKPPRSAGGAAGAGAACRGSC